MSAFARAGGSLIRAAALGAALLAAGAAPGPRAESIYYQQGEDGTIRLTNAPSSREYHTYFTTGRYQESGDVGGLYADYIRRSAKKFDVDPRLIRAVIAAESNFDPRAVSPKGARGLMQLMPSTASRFGVKNVFDPGQNIAGGARYLRYLLDMFRGDVVLALAAYNAGEGVVQSTGGVPDYRETRNYVDRVLSRYSRASSGRGRSTGADSSGRKGEARARTRIYKAVSGDGALIFSDSPIPEPVRE